jgi:hypothetical protein
MDKDINELRNKNILLQGRVAELEEKIKSYESGEEYRLMQDRIQRLIAANKKLSEYKVGTFGEDEKSSVEDEVVMR